MTKLKFYQFAALGLLLLNLVLVFFFFLGRPPSPADPLTYARETLRLDEGQQEMFMASVRAHAAEMRELNGRQSELLAAYFNQLTDTTATVAPLPAEHRDLEARKVEITYAHFAEVRSLLRPEQEVLFSDFIQEVLQRILIKSEPGRRDPSPR